MKINERIKIICIPKIRDNLISSLLSPKPQNIIQWKHILITIPMIKQ